MDRQPEVLVDLLTPAEHGVIAKLASKNASEAIRLSPLQRFGFSGAKLYKAYFTRNKTGIPFIVKTHANREIREEMAAFEQVQCFFEDCLVLQGMNVAYTSSHGAVAYKQFACGSGKRSNSTLELKDLLLDRTVAGNRLATCFRHLYRNTCGKAHDAVDRATLSLLDEYRRYFRHDRAVPRIECALGKCVASPWCAFGGVKIVNPLWILKKGFAQEYECSVGPVHGDLHASNVLLDEDDKPHLIDFSWARKKGPVLQDFVLMENSVRYMLFPRHMSPRDQLLADRALLKETGYLDFAKLPFSNSQSRRVYGRLGRVVGAIRSCAQRCAYQSFDEYLAAQFLVLYGLLSYDTYDFASALVGLGLIGHALVGGRFVPSA